MAAQTPAHTTAEQQSRVAPLVSFIVFAYNQEAYVRQAVEAALAQTWEPLEIILSDDASKDRTFDIMQEVVAGYSGPHRVILNRNPHNLGLIGHVNKVNAMAQGELIVVGAGDDISLPHRVAEQARVFVQHRGRAHSIHSAVNKISPSGEPLGVLTPPILKTDNSPEQLMYRVNGVIGAAHAWSRALCERFGPIRETGTYEDLVIAFRGALMGGVHYIPEPLVDYRYGTGISTTGLEAHSRREALLMDIKKARLWRATALQRAHDCAAVGYRGMALRLRYAALKASVKLAGLKIRLRLQRGT